MENLNYSVNNVFSNRDLTLTILSYLEKKEWVKSAVVNKLWNSCTHKIAITKIKNDFKKIVNLTTSKLNEDQIKDFKNIELKIDLPLKEQCGLSKLSSSVNEIEQLILNILVNLKRKELEVLDEISKNKRETFFQNVYLLTLIQKDTNGLDKINDADAKSGALIALVESWIKIGRFKKAIETANAIPIEKDRSMALQFVIDLKTSRKF